MSRLLVSACLMGQKVRYDGRAKTLLHDCLTRWDADDRIVPFCPELAGGLPVPRLPAEIEPGANGDDVLAGRARVLDSAGVDVTAPFVDGAHQAVSCALSHGCTHALLTEASPSCGSRLLYNGHHDGRQRPGFGVTTAALRAAGIAVYAPDQIDALALDCAW
ncbi:hypothetical protein GCM10016455_32130 [Aliiroseovarius zhejiangensis]|uniref:DUF523 domain-containing protein n=1 Tax=Aliiroseovarius zhejiangensis TaxID=1632025 RepID=A0ABQ3J8F9_9RHOB|nr:DUF523 domain-containing protein [Aliiroseovarius zhejiangensis]GHF08778.1 hypothetical protein GCM10016455_32130 [Aliiroseovarius zhejiangensis]